MSAGHGRGGHGRRRAKGGHEEEHENHERWAVSYADMMTVLVGLFIVLYAVSQVDQVKFEALRQSLAAGFGHRAPSMLQGSTGALTGVEDFQIVPDLAGETGIETEQVLTPEVDRTETERTMAQAVAEYDRLQEIAQQIGGALAAQELDSRVRFRVTERGLVIGMVADDVFFEPDSARLTGTAQAVVDVVAPVLAALPDELSVEGHANVLPTAAYPTNWELSSDRATQVLRRLVETGGVPAARISAVGMGDARPLSTSPSAASLGANRRVDVVVLSGVPEEVRALLPSLATAAPPLASAP